MVTRDPGRFNGQTLASSWEVLRQRNAFCELANDFHTTGSVRDDLIFLNNSAAKKYTLAGDTLALLEAGEGGGDLPFARQALDSLQTPPPPEMALVH